MASNEEIQQTTRRLESVLNQIPSYYYVPKDYLDDFSNDYGTFLTSIELIPKKEAQGERKKNIKYHPAFWYTTSFVAQKFPSPRDSSQLKTCTVSRSELLRRLSKSKVTCQQTAHSEPPVKKSSGVIETKKPFLLNKEAVNNPSNQQMTTAPIVRRKTKRKRLVEALHLAKDQNQVLSQLQEDEKKEYEKKLARDVALRRVMGERVYTDVKRIKKALKTRKKKQLKRKTKTN